ncbi:MAG: GDP-mannose 4,6-dehydratase [Alphaproteobacteria bacterium]|nr:GDP-mannose 4,6-dehydratase [Alphaproteobacteria bacterium]
MPRKIALITGVTGQDGAYLAVLLLAKGYEVHGVKRRASSINTARITGLLDADGAQQAKFFLHEGDLTDSGAMLRIVQETRPDEIYNLAAQSHVHVSFQTPEYTANTDAIGPLRLLEAIRILGHARTVRFYQASSSEMFGNAAVTPQDETTPFHPRSPYAAAKLYAHWITVNYREAYGIHACNGILFNHESPLRGDGFVTRTITRAVAEIALGQRKKLFLGNLDARRDWGHARDYVEGMWRILQHPTAGDWVLATGVTHSVREFATLSFAEAGIGLQWRGTGNSEAGFDMATGNMLVAVDPALFRPLETNNLCGDARRARDMLGWSPVASFRELIHEMVSADLAEVRSRKP